MLLIFVFQLLRIIQINPFSSVTYNTQEAEKENSTLEISRQLASKIKFLLMAENSSLFTETE